MITDLWLMQDGIAEGHAIVVDMEGATLSHLAKVNIIALKKFMFYIQACISIIIVGVAKIKNSCRTFLFAGSIARSLAWFTFH